MDAPSQGRGVGSTDQARTAVEKNHRDRRAATELGAYARLLASSVRKLEQNWPLSVAIILLAFMVLSFLRPA